jgi:hypothetical protein
MNDEDIITFAADFAASLIRIGDAAMTRRASSTTG